MRIAAFAALLLAGSALPAFAHQPTPAPAATTPVATPAPEDAALATAPATAERFAIVSSAGEHGHAERWRDGDGAQMYRELILLRGMATEVDGRVVNAPSGLPLSIVIRGRSPNGDAGETFTVSEGMARWHSPVDEGQAVAEVRRAYVPNGGPSLMIADLAERLIAEPDRRMALLPGGEARMEPLGELTVSGHQLQLWGITGLGLWPVPVWMEGNRFFAVVYSLAWLPVAVKDQLPAMQRAQDEALARLNPAFVQRFGQMPGVPVAFEHVRLFNSVEGVWRSDQTVVANGRYIVAVGPAASTAIPAGARRIDGSGKTLVPGLWDSHMHFSDDATGPLLLSMGVTSARDPGADVEPAIARLNRIAIGQLLAPTIFTSVLIDGAGPLAAQGGVVVHSAEETVAAVNRAHDAGFKAVKFYTSMQPDWLRAGIVEAHRLGMHVHGHVPATMRASDAIAAGYDEITHINFIAMQAMPDAVVNASNGFARFEGPGRYARSLDLADPRITGLLDTMANRGIISDPTLVAFEGILAAEPGQINPAYTAFTGTLPAMIERATKSGGFAPPADLTRADYQASFRRLVELVGLMQRRGVPIVAGTDGSGLELVHELELYVQAGMTPAQALQSATIRPARLVGADQATGSITIGKEADMVLVDGDPSADIGALRHTLWVMSDGKLIDANALRAAAGFNGMPH